MLEIDPLLILLVFGFVFLNFAEVIKVSQSAQKMNRKFARLLAVLFGFTLFFEVACLPLMSSFSLQVEKSMFAAGTELDELDEAEKGFDLLPLFTTVDLIPFTVDLIHGESYAANHSTQKDLPAIEPAFIQYHSLRI